MENKVSKNLKFLKYQRNNLMQYLLLISIFIYSIVQKNLFNAGP